MSRRYDSLAGNLACAEHRENPLQYRRFGTAHRNDDLTAIPHVPTCEGNGALTIDKPSQIGYFGNTQFSHWHYL